jgi:hypothetical protein
VWKNPRSPQDLDSNTKRSVAGTDGQTLRKIVRDTMRRVTAFLQEDGGHFQHLLQLKILIVFFISSKSKK